MKIKKQLAVLVSGGRSSAKMARHIQTSPKYDDYEKLFIFCNTGMERPETIQFLKDMVKYWRLPLNIIEGVYSLEDGVGVKSRLVDFDTMHNGSEIFTGAISQMNKHKWVGVPNQATPYCSGYLKTRPAHHFAKQIFGSTKYVKALGYRLEDVPKRITFTELSVNPDIIAPLLTDFPQPVGQLALNRFFDNEPFKLRLHGRLGNCELCWKKSDKNLIEAIQHGTRFINWHRKMEDKYENSFFRGGKTIDDLVKLAESGIQTSLFEDSGDSCVCSFNEI